MDISGLEKFLINTPCTYEVSESSLKQFLVFCMHLTPVVKLGAGVELVTDRELREYKNVPSTSY